jgi:hypothetical protein
MTLLVLAGGAAERGGSSAGGCQINLNLDVELLQLEVISYMEIG